MDLKIATKITIQRPNGTGILTKAEDGKWDIELNGQKPGSATHYDQAQVEKIVADMINKGITVVIG